MSSIPPMISPAWSRYPSELAGTVTVEAAGQETHVELTEEALRTVHLPLLAYLAARCDALRQRPAAEAASRRLLAGLTGIPGGGKSVLAAVLAQLSERVLGPGFMAAVGMDGWHYPNVVLDQRRTIGAEGRMVPLRERKGGPESYDVPAFAQALRALRAAGGDERLPVYDRRLHDPVPAGLMVPAGSRVILVEGNYLLCDSPPWNEVGPLLDVKLYLACDPARARDRIIARHLRGGLSAPAAIRKYATNDALNAELVLASAGRADYVLRF